ncbi:MAG: hypothetical protein RL235_83, partial [Chlamydiota bacterium]
KDKAQRTFQIPLQTIPFVLQRKAEPLYPAIYREGLQEQFLTLVRRRMEIGLTDKDHDVEHNFGVIEGKVVQIDPGRFGLFTPSCNMEHEWWSATHRYWRWVEKRR